MKCRYTSVLLPLCTIVVTLSLCGCAPAHGLDERFLPVTLGIAKQEDAFAFTFGGYEPQQGDAPEAVYKSMQVQSDHVLDAFESSDLSFGMLTSLVVSCPLAQQSLYTYYAPFIYNDDSSEGMYLCFSFDPARLLDEPPQNLGDVNDFLKEESLHCPSILAYDVAMRTPGESCLVPVLRKNEEDAIELDRIAVCCRESIAGYLDASLATYVHLLRGYDVEMLVDFDIPSLDSGTVRVQMQSDVSMQKDADRYVYDVHLFGSGLVNARTSTHESITQPSDSAQIAEAVNASLEETCTQIVRIAQENLGVDIFGFSRLALARDRGSIKRDVHTLFAQNSVVMIESDVVIRNLTQIH